MDHGFLSQAEPRRYQCSRRLDVDLVIDSSDPQRAIGGLRLDDVGEAAVAAHPVVECLCWIVTLVQNVSDPGAARVILALEICARYQPYRLTWRGQQRRDEFRE